VIDTAALKGTSVLRHAAVELVAAAHRAFTLEAFDDKLPLAPRRIHPSAPRVGIKTDIAAASLSKSANQRTILLANTVAKDFVASGSLTCTPADGVRLNRSICGARFWSADVVKRLGSRSPARVRR
jgi:hypothetical protein